MHSAWFWLFVRMAALRSHTHKQGLIWVWWSGLLVTIHKALRRMCFTVAVQTTVREALVVSATLRYALVSKAAHQGFHSTGAKSARSRSQCKHWYRVHTALSRVDQSCLCTCMWSQACC
jgi:hypothetical protein